MAQAQGSRAPVQALADRVSAVFVPAILVLAALTLAGWWWHAGTLGLAWRPAVTLLVIACPCALGLATPVAMAAALGTAARDGLLVRDAAAMEALARITDLAFDKTGTLTQGRPALLDVRSGARTGTRCCAWPRPWSGTRSTRWPWASGPPPRGWTPAGRKPSAAVPGLGVEGRVEGRDLRLGSAAFLGLELPGAAADGLVVGLAEGRLLGALVLADARRPEARGGGGRPGRPGPAPAPARAATGRKPAADLAAELGIPQRAGRLHPGRQAGPDPGPAGPGRRGGLRRRRGERRPGPGPGGRRHQPARAGGGPGGGPPEPAAGRAGAAAPGPPPGPAHPRG